MKQDNAITVEFVNPPIPVRNFDWCASRQDGDDDSPCGYGATAEEAIADLLELESEDA